jgi:hypothetical protein
VLGKLGVASRVELITLLVTEPSDASSSD